MHLRFDVNWICMGVASIEAEEAAAYSRFSE